VSSPTPRKLGAPEAIRKFCVACMGGSYILVAQCTESSCPLHEFRQSPAPDVQKATRPPVRAIRRQCLACCCGDRARVRACAASPACQAPFDPCVLWRFRLGSRPEIFERRKKKARSTLLTLPGLTLEKTETA
jgi:hypothetical protein